KPSINGTGTEDYFSSGWYFDRGLYSAPYHGVLIKDTDNGRVSAYRWHIEDAMPFHSSIRVTIEHGTENNHECDYSSVAYWYQTEPPAPFGPTPLDSDALPDVPPRHLAGGIDGTTLVESAEVTEGPIDTQSTAAFGPGWKSESQLFWRPTRSGAEMTLH